MHIGGRPVPSTSSGDPPFWKKWRRAASRLWYTAWYIGVQCFWGRNSPSSFFVGRRRMLPTLHFTTSIDICNIEGLSTKPLWLVASLSLLSCGHGIGASITLEDESQQDDNMALVKERIRTTGSGKIENLVDSSPRPVSGVYKKGNYRGVTQIPSRVSKVQSAIIERAALS